MYNLLSIFCDIFLTGFIFVIVFRALASIMVIKDPCPYPEFTSNEWKKILGSNQHKINYTLPSDISTALNAAALKTVFGDNIFMTANDNELSIISCNVFNGL